jgi:hypothetical protein
MEPHHHSKPRVVLKIGIATHRTDSIPVYKGRFKALGESAKIATEFEVLEGTKEDGWADTARTAVQIFLKHTNPHLLILEWNLGNRNNVAPTFTPEFFDHYPKTKFLLRTATIIPGQDLAAYALNVNVETGWINHDAAGLVGITEKVFTQVVAVVRAADATKNDGDSGNLLGETEADEAGEVATERNEWPLLNGDDELQRAGDQAEQIADQSLRNNATLPKGTPFAQAGGDHEGGDHDRSDDGDEEGSEVRGER